MRHVSPPRRAGRRRRPRADARGQDLAGATGEQLAAVELWGNGHALRREELDAGFSVPGLLEARFGNKKWMEQWGGSGWNARVTPKEEHAAAEPVRHWKAS